MRGVGVGVAVCIWNHKPTGICAHCVVFVPGLVDVGGLLPLSCNLVFLGGSFVFMANFDSSLFVFGFLFNIILEAQVGCLLVSRIRLRDFVCLVLYSTARLFYLLCMVFSIPGNLSSDLDASKLVHFVVLIWVLLLVEGDLVMRGPRTLYHFRPRQSCAGIMRMSQRLKISRGLHICNLVQNLSRLPVSSLKSLLIRLLGAQIYLRSGVYSWMALTRAFCEPLAALTGEWAVRFAIFGLLLLS